MKKQLTFACALVSVLAASALSSCGGTKYDYTIKVWCPEAAKSLTTTQAQKWADAIGEAEGVKIGITVQAVGEGDAASNMITDVDAGADLFFFAQDQLSRLVSSGALTEIIDDATIAKLKAENDEASIAAASTSTGEIYSLPLTSDNGYFMYYDKAVFTDTSKLENMADIIDVCRAAGKKIYFNAASSAWYSAAYFYGFGCESTWETNSAGLFTGYVDTYNSDEGIKACKAMYDLIKSDNVNVYTDSASVSEGFTPDSNGNRTAAVVISGTWDYTVAVTQLGNDLGATDLPSVTVDEETVHLSSFSGCKLLGVKPQKDAMKAAYVQSLADVLSGEQGQHERFEALGWGPSNVKDQETDTNAALAALALQNKYSTPQGQYPSDWWTSCAAIGTSLAKSDGSETAIRNILKVYNGTIDSYVNG